MRTKNRKRIGAVPITLVAVFALAALISVGLLLAPSGPTAEAQGIPSSSPNDVMGTKCEIDIATTALNEGTGCTTVGDSVDVVFTRADTNSPLSRVVYVTGDNRTDATKGIKAYPRIQANDDAIGDAPMSLGKKGVSEHLVTVPAASFGNDGKHTITVARSMAKGGEVYLFVYAISSGSIPIASSDTALPDNANGAVKVVFVGAPVEKADTDDDSSTPDKVVSALVLTDSDGTLPTDYIDFATSGGLNVAITKVSDLPVADDTVQVSSEFRDAELRSVSGNIVFAIGTPTAKSWWDGLNCPAMVAVVGSNAAGNTGMANMDNPYCRMYDDLADAQETVVDATYVDLHEGVADVKFSGGGKERTAFKESQGSFLVVDIPEDIPLRIPVTATMTAESGTLPLKSNIIRIGDAVAVEAKAYACKPDEDDDGYAEMNTPMVRVGNECTSEIAALKKSGTEGDPKEIGALQNDDIFTIFGEAVDMLGNKRADALTWKSTPNTDTSDVIDSTNANAESVITIAADDDELGSYSITVESDDGEASATIEFAVSGEPKDYQIDGPAEIGLDGDRFAQYTVKATDVNGNPAAGSDNCVLVKALGADPFDVADHLTVLTEASGEPCAGETKLDTKGGATFTIDAPPGVSSGATVILQVRVDNAVEARKTVTFVAMTTVTQPMLTKPSDVTAMSDAAGMATVRWTPGDNALGHLVFLFKSDFSGDPMVGVPSGNAHTFSDVPAGSYIAVVVSYRSGSDYEYEALTSVVTVQ